MPVMTTKRVIHTLERPNALKRRKNTTPAMMRGRLYFTFFMA